MWGRRGRRQSAQDYAQERLRQLGDQGGELISGRIEDLGDQVMLLGRIRRLGTRGHGELDVFEVVSCDGNGVPTRVKYSYQAMYGKKKLWRYDRDPVNHPEMPEHKHVGESERRVKCGRITLHAVMQELWADILLLERS